MNQDVNWLMITLPAIAVALTAIAGLDLLVSCRQRWLQLLGVLFLLAAAGISPQLKGLRGELAPEVASALLIRSVLMLAGALAAFWVVRTRGISPLAHFSAVLHEDARRTDAPARAHEKEHAAAR